MWQPPHFYINPPLFKVILPLAKLLVPPQVTQFLEGPNSPPPFNKVVGGGPTMQL